MYPAIERGLLLGILWDHQACQFDVWSVVKQTQNREAALEFIRYASRTQSLARQTNYIPYGPVRRSAIKLVDPSVRKRLPTTPANFKTAFDGNAQWWAENLDRIEPRFERWLRRHVMVPW